VATWHGVATWHLAGVATWHGWGLNSTACTFSLESMAALQPWSWSQARAAPACSLLL
jgi:hypothetical protein